ncbi:FAD-binding protein [uncultured Erythrobacter sp.]|uniref:FAD-binding protein n=1 Tax=uncultured Erythrobacter sp. TaxID=263913 RepID=UPI0026351DD8|nr:FAD-binding protein [uncultured Erythrobacter sp.]
MATDPQIREISNTNWINWHRTYAVDAARHLQLRPASGSLRPASFKRSAELVLDLIEEARTAGATIRPMGANWSFSQVSAQQDAWLLDTSPANRKALLGPAALDPGFTGDPDSLLLTQCGTSVHEINQYLERQRERSLATSGASNGQTIVGAMSTGTHGSAIDHGGIQSLVVAIQLLTVDGQNLWLERPSRPVVAQSLAESFGAVLTRDDEKFEAALVSLGLLGVIHSVVIETRPRFLLSASQFEHPYDDTLRQAMRNFDPRSLDIPGDVTIPPGNPQPYFFQAVFNPHAPDDPARVKIMYELPWDPDYEIDYRQQGKFGPAYDLPGFVGKLLDVLDPLTPFVTTEIFKLQLKLFRNEIGSWGEMFNFTTPRSQTAGVSVAVPAARCDEALDIALKTHARFGPAPIAFACRFVQKSPGHLAFTRYDPSCVIDMDGLNSVNTHAIVEHIRRALDEAEIPYAQHWGKFHDLTGGRLANSYGGDLDRFLAARNELLPNAADKRTFSLAAQETVIGL